MSANVAEQQIKAADVHLRRGVAYAQQNRLREAYEEFRAGLGCNPQNVALYYNAGNVLGALGRAADAVACLTHAAKLEPKSAEIYVSLSNALFHNGELDFALRARAQAWILDQSLAESRFEISASPIAARPEGPAAS